jgi:hypothetical protein
MVRRGEERRYSITLSTRLRIAGEMARPIAVAVSADEAVEPFLERRIGKTAVVTRV